MRDLHPGYLSTRIAEELGLERVHRGAAPPRPHRRGPGRARRDRPGARRGVRRHRATATTARSGAPSSWSRTRRLPPRGRTCATRPLPGGDLAARTPWRAALGYLSLEPVGGAGASRSAFEGVDPRERAVAERQIDGRAQRAAGLLDGPAVRRRRGRARRAALSRLRGPGGDGARGAGRPPAGSRVSAADLEGRGRRLAARPAAAARRLGERRQRGRRPRRPRRRFPRQRRLGHGRAGRAGPREAAGLATVALGGGVFQNARLLASLREPARAARASGCSCPRRLGPNDGAISYGQAAVAAARLARGR